MLDTYNLSWGINLQKFDLLNILEWNGSVISNYNCNCHVINMVNYIISALCFGEEIVASSRWLICSLSFIWYDSISIAYGCFVGLRPSDISATVGEPFHVNCSVRNTQHNVDSSMLEFCIQYPNSTIVNVDDHVHVRNRASSQLIYTLHTPLQAVGHTKVICFLKKSSSGHCSWTNSRKISTVTVGCK